MKIKSKFPLVLDSLRNGSPVLRPSGAYDIPYLFGEEIGLIVAELSTILGIESVELFNLTCKNYMNCESTEMISPTILYMYIINSLAYQGDSAETYTPGLGYLKLMHSEAVAFLQTLTVDAMRLRIQDYIKTRDPRLQLSVGVEKNSMFLFYPTLVSKEAEFDFVQQPSRQEMHTDEIIERNSEAVEDLTLVIQQMFPKKSPRKLTRHPSEWVEEKGEVTPESENPDAFSELLNKIITMRPGYKPLFSSYWMAPPPISPLDLYSLDTLAPAEAALILDLFLDLYHTEMLLLSVHFLMKRLQELWRPCSSGGIIEGALFQSEERMFIEKLMTQISREISNSFSVRFLAIEGIALGGTKLHDQLEKIYSKSTSDIDPIIAVNAFLQEQLDLIRDVCLCADRLRVSVLYGRLHKSYLGDGFLSSFISLFYKIQHAELSFDSIIALINPISAMSLPKDEEKIQQFIDSLCVEIPKESSRHNITEPEARQKYMDTSPAGRLLATEGKGAVMRNHLDTEGILESERRIDNDSTLFGLLEKMWGIK